MTRKQLIRELCRREGGKVNLSIAQCSEVVSKVLAILSELPASDALKLIERVRK